MDGRLAAGKHEFLVRCGVFGLLGGALAFSLADCYAALSQNPVQLLACTFLACSFLACTLS